MVWRIGQSAAGTAYYHNTETGETTWDRPAELGGDDSSDSSDETSGDQSSSSSSGSESEEDHAHVYVDKKKVVLPRKSFVYLAATDSETGKEIFVNSRGEQSQRRPTVAMYHTDDGTSCAWGWIFCCFVARHTRQCHAHPCSPDRSYSTQRFARLL